jgi:hypothetical protein
VTTKFKNNFFFLKYKLEYSLVYIKVGIGCPLYETVNSGWVTFVCVFNLLVLVLVLLPLLVFVVWPCFLFWGGCKKGFGLCGVRRGGGRGIAMGVIGVDTAIVGDMVPAGRIAEEDREVEGEGGGGSAREKGRGGEVGVTEGDA